MPDVREYRLRWDRAEVTKSGRKRPWWDRLFCALGLHRWDMPGGHCESCGRRDDFFDE